MQDQQCLDTGRIAIGASDYSTALYSYDEGPADPELKRFSIDHDRDYVCLPCVPHSPRIPICFCSAPPWSLLDG